MTNIGIIARVAGVVVDVEFPSGDLPGIRNALTITRQNDEPLIVEVQEHIDPYTVRTVAMDTTSGLSRGLPVHDTGGPVRVPIGRATLGRMFNVLGQPIDDQPDLRDSPKRPIHAVAPPLRDQQVAAKSLVTGIKAIARE